MKQVYESIRPGQVWLDTKGERIQAHGGSVLFFEGWYYWYGENKEFTDLGEKLTVNICLLVTLGICHTFFVNLA